MKHNLIGLAGKKGSGKSYLAKAMWQRLHDVEVMSFASRIKWMARAMGVPHESIYGSEKEKPLELFGGRSGRRIMQMIGTEFGRDMIDQNLWINLARRDYEEQAKTGSQYVIFDDVRFDNEAQMIKDCGGMVIEVVNTKQESSDDTHRSESGVSKGLVDFRILNNLTYDPVEELRKALVDG